MAQDINITLGTKPRNQTPMEAYREEMAKIRRYMNELNEAVEEMESKDGGPSGDKGPTWGDICDAARTAAQLEDVTDRIYSRGDMPTLRKNWVSIAKELPPSNGTVFEARVKLDGVFYRKKTWWGKSSDGVSGWVYGDPNAPTLWIPIPDDWRPLQPTEKEKNHGKS